jgi:hypothetical protein
MLWMLWWTRWAVAVSAGSASVSAAGQSCRSTGECGFGELCIRNKGPPGSDYGCHRVFVGNEDDAPNHGSLPDTCFTNWPSVANCSKWSVNGSSRVLESNGVPPYYVPPYCPFGKGEGYCQVIANSTDCLPFAR